MLNNRRKEIYAEDMFYEKRDFSPVLKEWIKVKKEKLEDWVKLMSKSYMAYTTGKPEDRDKPLQEVIFNAIVNYCSDSFKGKLSQVDRTYMYNNLVRLHSELSVVVDLITKGVGSKLQDYHLTSLSDIVSKPFSITEMLLTKEIKHNQFKIGLDPKPILLRYRHKQEELKKYMSVSNLYPHYKQRRYAFNVILGLVEMSERSEYFMQRLLDVVLNFNGIEFRPQLTSLGGARNNTKVYVNITLSGEFRDIDGDTELDIAYEHMKYFNMIELIDAPNVSKYINSSNMEHVKFLIDYINKIVPRCNRTPYIVFGAIAACVQKDLSREPVIFGTKKNFITNCVQILNEILSEVHRNINIESKKYAIVTPECYVN